MEASFNVITDVAEIARHNATLGNRLARAFEYTEPREVTSPAGHWPMEVRFESGYEKLARAWAPDASEGRLRNFILYGVPGKADWLEISVELNFPADQYNRRPAGAFVKDSSGDVLIAHRGKLTKGKGALKKRDVFREFGSLVVEADDDGKTSKLILISSLDSPDLVKHLWNFAEEARVVAIKLGAARDSAEHSEEEAGGRRRRSAPIPAPVVPAKRPGTAHRLIALRKYFDEFAGSGQVKGHGAGRRTVEHGTVVKALEAQLRKTGETQKAQAIDLAVVCKSRVNLFEVKTSARTTDVYTGVGQLLIHGESIAERLALPVDRYLVLPEQPNHEHARHISTKGRMKIVIFSKTARGYRFDGI